MSLWQIKKGRAGEARPLDYIRCIPLGPLMQLVRAGC
jgi:hypothetical protein